MDVQTLGEDDDDDDDDDERNPQRNLPRNHNPHDLGYNAEDIVEDEEEYIDFEDIANHEHPDIILEADIGSLYLAPLYPILTLSQSPIPTKSLTLHYHLPVFQILPNLQHSLLT